MLRALERGLTLSDFENMTVGMIMDFVITYNNWKLDDGEEHEGITVASQADFDSF